MSTAPATLQRPTSSAHASSSTATARPQVRASSSAIIPDTTTFQGTFPISIGAGTAIHPRVKIYSFDGPVLIGEGCIIGEKSIIGAPSVPEGMPPKQSVRDSSSAERPARHTVVENFVNVGPLCTISSGVYIRYCTTIEASAYLGANVRVGKHSKVCPNCKVPDGRSVGEWSVVWGGPGSLRSRKRASGDGPRESSGKSAGLGGRAVEDGRLIVLNKEREIVRKLMAANLSARKK
ncbi:Trimeric LpxA-like protein [Ascosphaera apis ARSEF 7405]|uniref:Dynactin subunit 6 n=1 Tax=Ascosphaera apis ARSEF 7405 TaxID=392613 RepID=A0A167ZRR1_9EURO|nr:Trimeric LpxA-like protein [Ascosphaera apis ARSEF 7405]